MSPAGKVSKTAITSPGGAPRPPGGWAPAWESPWPARDEERWRRPCAGLAAAGGRGRGLRWGCIAETRELVSTAGEPSAS